MIEIKVSDPVYQFLGGIFHQDIESPESALEEYLDEVSQKVTEFMNNEYSKEEKNDFIEKAADGVYPLSC